MAATVQLDNGTTYRGRAIVSYPSIVVTHDAVIAELAKYGITPARVWFNASELPPDWPLSAKADVSPSFTTQIYLEGTWTKPSGKYATSGPKWGIYDYWVFKAAPKAYVPPPPATDTPPPVVNPDCVAEGMSCQSQSCCESLTCQEYDGGMLCMKPAEEEVVPPEPIKLELDAKVSDWWYAAGAAAVVGIGWMLFPKLLPRPATENPAAPKKYRVLFDKTVPLGLINLLAIEARKSKLVIETPTLQTEVPMVFVYSKHKSTFELIRRRFYQAWRDALTENFRTLWGDNWWQRGGVGRDEYIPDVMKD